MSIRPTKWISARIEQLRQKQKAAYEAAGAKLTYTAFIAKATIDAIGEFPFANASIDGENIVYKRDINLGIAVALDQGLIVPVIRDAANRSMLDLCVAIADLALRARSKQLKTEDVQGGTFTITNPGIFGAVFGLPIISQPQVAILGVGSDREARGRGGRHDRDSADVLPHARLRPPTDRRRRWRPLPAGAQGPPAELRRIVVVSLSIRRLGLVPYDEALELQQQLVEDRRAGRIGDTLLLLQHPPVITLGAKTRHGPNHIVATPKELAAEGVTVFETGRGGDVTYHGPGQLVGYPILDLRPDRCDVHQYVRDLEELLIRTAAVFGITATRVPGLSGAWVGPAGREEKLAAIGIRISRWITSHGFALNVSTNLKHFDLIVPCGIADRGVTSLERLLGRPVSMAEVEDAVEGAWGQTGVRPRTTGV